MLPNVCFIVDSPSCIKDFLIVIEQQEADLIKKQKEERRALREKKALQKANKLANLPGDGEGDHEPRTSPTVRFLLYALSFLLLVFMISSLSPGR